MSDGRKLFSLRHHADANFHGHSVGGTNSALVQAMFCGTPTVARATLDNQEVLAEAGEFVEPTPGAIIAAVTRLREDSDRQEALSGKAFEGGREHYSWDGVCRLQTDAAETDREVAADALDDRDRYRQTRKNTVIADSIRLVPELRSVHLERYPRTTPALMLYFTENYDLATAMVPAEIRKIRLGDVIPLFWRSRATILEMPEPLWVRFLVKGIVIAVAFRVTGALRGRRRMVVTYAMENNDVARLIGGRRPVPSLVVKAFSAALGLYIRTVVDRLAFASPSSRDLYLELPFVRGVEHRTVTELPSALRADDATVERGSAVFVGVLEERKGIRPLLAAWERVEQRDPAARLTLIGPGPLADEVRTWVDRRPQRREWAGQLGRDAILERLGRSGVLIAPSIPAGRWREQIGLPIKEALSLGLTVVTTDQTGLAEWLARHGHRVVPASAPVLADRLAQEILGALDALLPRPAVRASLPVLEGRLDSDGWLHRPRGSVAAPVREAAS